MGTIKNQKDKIVGNAKEKIGELLDNENLKQEGRDQTEIAEAHDAKYKERIEELEDQQAEKEARQQDLTQERKTAEPKRRKEPLPEQEHISGEQRIEEERMKHYTGIEEKL
ncbi:MULTISPECIES: hypothetical protein [unclassified Enterococcus]|jgi:uncharacterized protein YjbJ (UPF0337 family)|uniref:hypothetical protein n=1 Tax=unclassified Enterococcus TaxID=2608891 RepID=UPI0003532938|nr:hypothetical protein D920_02022 [Enterococcus faecalis 13-SD-W-01]